MHINDLSLFQALQSGLWYSVEEANHNTETLKCVFIHEHSVFLSGMEGLISSLLRNPLSTSCGCMHLYIGVRPSFIFRYPC